MKAAHVEWSVVQGIANPQQPIIMESPISRLGRVENAHEPARSAAVQIGSSMSTTARHIFWRQDWDSKAETILVKSLEALNVFARELPSQRWDISRGTIGDAAIRECAFVAPAGDRWSVIQLPVDAPLTEELAEELSRQSEEVALVLNEVGQICWGYRVYDRGSSIHRFWNMPAMVDADPVHCSGDASELGRLVGAPSAAIRPYLRHVSPDEIFEGRAFVSDEYTLGDPWVRVDFLRHLGLAYPNPVATPSGRYIHISTNRPRLTISSPKALPLSEPSQPAPGPNRPLGFRSPVSDWSQT